MSQAKTTNVQTSEERNPLGVLAGLLILFVLALVAWWLAKQVYGAKLPFGIPGKVLEFPLWAAIVGLIGNALLKMLGWHETVHPGIRTELFLKIGLVLLGAGVNLSLLLTA
ncbi:MAG: putative sulfate exporter family transporter, partial [Chloroflexi bacterium]|nr:putative sulfate exporter family transporter [Chloroflexota bacterium]